MHSSSQYQPLNRYERQMNNLFSVDANLGATNLANNSNSIDNHSHSYLNTNHQSPKPIKIYVRLSLQSNYGITN